MEIVRKKRREGVVTIGVDVEVLKRLKIYTIRNDHKSLSSGIYDLLKKEEELREVRLG
ncbi:MAG: hypothetical protein WCW14_05190 [Candidatus Paceibacterota bacterium]